MCLTDFAYIPFICRNGLRLYFTLNLITQPHPVFLDHFTLFISNISALLVILLQRSWTKSLFVSKLEKSIRSTVCDMEIWIKTTGVEATIQKTRTYRLK